MKHVQIYTDGSCLGNPGPGGWAAIVRLAGTAHERELFGAFADTTNNRMEMRAVLEGLAVLKEVCQVDIYTDSQYVSDSIEKGWIYGWKKKNWVKANKDPVKNKDLWQAIWPFLQKHKVKFHWIRGHAGHVENERCDTLARTAAAGQHLPADEELPTGSLYVSSFLRS